MKINFKKFNDRTQPWKKKNNTAWKKYHKRFDTTRTKLNKEINTFYKEV